MQIWSYSWKLFHNSRNVKKAPQESHIHKTAKWKSTSNKLKEEICFILILFLFYSHYSSEQKKVDKYSISWETWFFFFFLVNHLKRGAWIVCRFKRGLGKRRRHVFELRSGWDPNVCYELEEPSYWHKYPKQITLYHSIITNNIN